MNTQTHVLMGMAIFGRSSPRLAWAAAAGGFVPDLPMLGIVAVLRMLGHSFGDIFEKFYWEPWWQIANALGHSFLIWSALTIGSAIVLARRRASAPTSVESATGAAPLVFALSASALLHSIIDFFCHREDAHMHFWPLSDWRLMSPVSYWDVNHYGRWFGLFETAVGIASIIVLFRRYRSKKLRAALLLALALYVAVPLFFFLNFGPPDHGGLPGATDLAMVLVQD